jgi:hypothetical protein
MRYRTLRIAWSVVWGIAAVLLIALWVLSYWRLISAMGMIGSRWMIVETERGESELHVVPGKTKFSWHIVPLALVDAARQRTPAGGGQLPRNTRGGFGLRWWTYGRGFGGKVSLLHPIAIAAALAALPWIRWSNRFSLRTLLIATTLVAVVLGLMVYVAR